MQDCNYFEYFDYLIKKYLKRYDVITKQSIDDILEVYNDLHLIKIIDVNYILQVIGILII